jgi:hypothetical protein
MVLANEDSDKISGRPLKKVERESCRTLRATLPRKTTVSSMISAPRTELLQSTISSRQQR